MNYGLINKLTKNILLKNLTKLFTLTAKEDFADTAMYYILKKCLNQNKRFRRY